MAATNKRRKRGRSTGDLTDKRVGGVCIGSFRVQLTAS